MLRTRLALLAVLGMALIAGSARADLTSSLKEGTPELKSVGALAFGPEGVLFVGDSQAAAIFAIDTGDRTPSPAGPFKIEGIDEKIAALLGTEVAKIQINDLAVNPASGRAYLSLTRDKGPNATPVILRADNQGKMEEFSLKNVKFAKTELPNPQKINPQTKARIDAITQLAYIQGRVFVAGLSNEEFSSNLKAIPFPFTEADKGSNIEIFHGAHGRIETNSPVRTFAAFDINGETNLLAAYTCTPLVKIPVSQLKAGERVKGTTIAELGNRNRPLDMIVYQKDGKNFVLIANSSRGVMKVSTENIDKVSPITKPVTGGGTAGLTYETIKDLKGIEQMDKLDKENALVLIRTESKSLNLQSVALP